MGSHNRKLLKKMEVTKDSAGTRVTADCVRFSIQWNDDSSHIPFHLSTDNEGYIYVSVDYITAAVGCSSDRLWTYAKNQDYTDMYGSTLMEVELPDGSGTVTKIKTILLSLALSWVTHEIAYNPSKDVKQSCASFLVYSANSFFEQVYHETREASLSD